MKFLTINIKYIQEILYSENTEGDTLGEALNKLIKLSRYGGFCAKALMILVAVGMIIMAALLVAVLIDPGLLDWVVTTGMTYDVPIDDIDVPAVATVIIVAVLIIGGLVIAMLYYIGRMLTNIHENNTPFTDDSARCLVAIAVLTVISTLVIPALDFALQTAIGTAYYQSYTISVFPLFVALLLYFLSLVFKHGAELQRESDETL